MYIILQSTKQTIAEKKKLIAQNQQEANQLAFDMANKVQNVMQLSNEVEMLESELYKLEKQVRLEESQSKSAPVANTSDCCISSASNVVKRYND